MSDYPKVLAVIRSCTTTQQHEVAEKMIRNFILNEYRKLFLRGLGLEEHLFIRRIVSASNELHDENYRLKALVDLSDQNKGAN